MRARRQVACRFAMREHGNKVGPRRLLRAFGPERPETGHCLVEDFIPLGFRIDFGAGPRVHRGDVRPVGQLVPLLEREVEQRRQHLGGQVDRHMLHPVEGFAARQAVQHAAGAFAYGAGQVLQVPRRDDRRNGLALLVVLRRIHGNEAGTPEIHRQVAQHDAAHQRVGRKRLLIGIDRHDVAVTGHRPVGAVDAVRAPVHRIFPPQAFEPGAPGVILV